MDISKYEICVQRKEDCKCYKKGYCIALADTRFKKECPFYKSKNKQVAK